MPGKKANIRINSPLFIVLIVMILLASSTLVIMSNGKGNSTSEVTTTQNAKNGSSEIYVALVPDIYPGYLKTKDIGSGQNISYDLPHTTFDLSSNQTINMTVAVINHENKPMNYSVMAYQGINNTGNNTFDVYQLYYGHLDNIMQDHTIGSLKIEVQAYPGDNTTIGVCLIDNENGNATVINTTEMYANVYQNLNGNSSAPEPLLFFQQILA